MIFRRLGVVLSKADLEVESRAGVDGRAFNTTLVVVVGSSGVVVVVGKFRTAFGTPLPPRVVDRVVAGRGRGGEGFGFHTAIFPR